MYVAYEICIESNSSIFQTHLPLILRHCSKWWKKLHPCLGFPHQLSTIFQRKIDMSTGLKFDLRFQQGILPSCPLERLTIGTFSKKSYMYLGLHYGKWAQSFETTSFLKSNKFLPFYIVFAMLQNVSANSTLSTSIYDLVLLNVCHFHHHHHHHHPQGFWKSIEILVLTSWILHPRIFASVVS